MFTNASRRPQRRNVTGPGNVDVNSIAGASRSVGERSLQDWELLNIMPRFGLTPVIVPAAPANRVQAADEER